MSDEFSGVSDAGTASAQMTDTSAGASPASDVQIEDGSPATGDGLNAVAPLATEGDNAPPAPEEPELDPAQIADEKGRNAFIHQRQRISELTQRVNQFDEVNSTLEQLGGLERVTADRQTFDSAFAEDADTRAQFHQRFYEESPEAYGRFLADIIADPSVQQQVLEASGLNPANLAMYQQWEQQGPPQGQNQTGRIDAGSLSIPQELHGAWNALPPEVQEEYAAMSDAMRNYSLQQAATAQAYRREQQEQAQQAEAARQAQIKAQRRQYAEQTYTSVQKTVRDALAPLFAGDNGTLDRVMRSAESLFYASPEGSAAWQEIDALIEKGEQRQVNAKLPDVIAKVKAIARQEAEAVQKLHTGARQWETLMRVADEETRLRIQNLLKQGQVNGGRREPAQSGIAITSNGIPNPNARGQYDPANIASYGR